MLIFYVLMLFVIVAALIAVETKNLLSSVICIGAAGFGGSLMFLFLRAPDIAITQIAVEVLGLIILIRATIARDRTFITGDREFFAVLVSVAILAVVLIIGIIVFNALPKFGQPAFAAIQNQPTASQSYIEHALERTGAANIVAAVILDFRAYDTLGEATVLFTSILGAVVILRKNPKLLPEIEQ
jgi:multicomponent Na+:H+ antiporter subunit B